MPTNTLAAITDALHACQVAITQLEPSVAQTNALAHVQDALRLVEQLQFTSAYEEKIHDMLVKDLEADNKRLRAEIERLQSQPTYEPITDESITRTVEIIIDGLDEYAGCRLCRRIEPQEDSHE